jgi:MATE family multidrug resistance protein
LWPFFFFADRSEGRGVDIAGLAAESHVLLNFVAVYSVFDALAVVFSSALRGAGDTLYPMVMILGCSWLVMVLPAWLVVHSDGASLTKLWMASSANIVLAGLLMLMRYRSGRWTKIQVVDIPEHGQGH